MRMEKTSIACEGGRLACLLFLPENQEKTVGTVIACHGFRGGKENGGRVVSLATKLATIGFRLLAFDFQGSGESSGKFRDMTLTRQAADLRLVLDYARTAWPGRIIVVGRSLGGSTVLAGTAGEENIDGRVLWSTPILVKETFLSLLEPWGREVDLGDQNAILALEDEYGKYELGTRFIRDLDNHDFRSYTILAGQRPLLVIHGEADQVVKPANALLIKELVPGAQLILVPDADHKFIHHWQFREDVTVAWIRSHFTV